MASITVDKACLVFYFLCTALHQDLQRTAVGDEFFSLLQFVSENAVKPFPTVTSKSSEKNPSSELRRDNRTSFMNRIML